MTFTLQKLKKYREWFGGGSEEERRKVLVLLFTAIAAIAFALIGVSAIGGQVDESGTPFSLILVPRLSPTFTTVLLLVFLVVVAAIGGLSFAFLRDRIRREIREEGNLQRFKIPRVVFIFVSAPLLIAALTVFIIFMVANLNETSESYGEQVQNSLEAAERAAEAGELEQFEAALQRQKILRYTPFVIVGLVLVVFLAILLFSDRLAADAEEQVRRASRITRELKRDLVRAADVALDDIAAESDNRKAVIACYGRFEAVLEIHSMMRAPYQTPTEFILSVIDEGPGLPEDALLDLTTIYELAEFSRHEITVDHKTNALSLLRAIRDFLVEELEGEPDDVAVEPEVAQS